MSFTIAMTATILSNGVTTPDNHTCERCLVVTRMEWAPGYLIVADSGPCNLPLPFSMPARRLMVGTLVKTDPLGNEIFRLNWALPRGLGLTSVFFPASGELVLDRYADVPELFGDIDTGPIPDFDDGLTGRVSRTVQARYLEWDGELREIPGVDRFRR